VLETGFEIEMSHYLSKFSFEMYKIRDSNYSKVWLFTLKCTFRAIIRGYKTYMSTSYIVVIIHSRSLVPRK